MTPLAWMIGTSLLAWLVVTLTFEASVHPELLLGMLGPLVSACATWIAVVRAHRRAPERVTTVLLAGFAAKVIFFGAYLVMMLRVADLRPVPFVVSFTSYTIGLYMIEALFLSRLTTIRESGH